MGRLALSGLFFYPVKSLAGIPVKSAELGVRGLAYDRHWMVVGNDGECISQRTHPRMALIKPALTAPDLRLTAPGMPPLIIAADEPKERCRVKIWKSVCMALSEGEEPARWFSHFLGDDCRLVRFDDAETRPVDTRYGKARDEVAFADGFPLLIVSQASINDLSRRLDDPVSIERFRPNLVIRGCGPFGEDSWRRIRIGPVGVRLVKPCTRCTIPGVDPTTGVMGEEPLKTLARYRRKGNRVLLGMNAIPDGIGEIREGMKVELLE